MPEVIISGPDPEPVSLWVLSAYDQGMLSPQQRALVDAVTGTQSAAVAELHRQAAGKPRIAELLAGLGGVTGLQQQVDALLAEEGDRL